MPTEVKCLVGHNPLFIIIYKFMTYLDRNIAPSFQTIKEVSFVHPEVYSLSNGLQMYSFHADSQAIVRLELIFKASVLFEEQIGESYFTTRMLTEGTTQKTSEEISNYLDQYGVFMETNALADRSIIVLYVLPKFLEPILLLLAEILQHCNFPEKELQNIQNIFLQNLQINKQKTSFLATQAFKKAIFPHHAYGNSIEEEHLQNINTSLLSTFYQKYFYQKPFDLIVSGYVDSAIRQKIENILGKMTLQADYTNPTKTINPSTETNTQSNWIEKSDSLQASIRLGSLLPTKTHKDFFHLSILNEIFGGYFGSRLMKNIREEKGYTYGIYSQLAMLQQAGYWVIGADVKGEFARATIQEIHKEAQKLRQELVPEEELETVRNYMLGSFASTLITPFDWADRFKSIHFFQLDYQYYENYFQTLQTFTAEEILQSANEYLHTEKMAEVVVGQKELIAEEN
ncbi:MAG: insulinase family protein [Cytophagales bacterium]|nr:MAG: insulinase family protein [Cytophagales bacterium]